MFSHLITPALALLITSALALPTPDSPPSAKLTESQLVSIAPKSSACAAAASECRTAAQAAGPIAASFATYNVTSPAEQAAIIATMAFESADFQYQMNHFPAPGRPGQGTRNMQSPQYNLMYAQSIPELGSYLKKIDTSDPKAVLTLLVTYINYDFGSGAWFLTSQCDSSVRSKLQSGSADGFGAYVGCIGTTMTSDRTTYYQRAAKALGVKTSN